MDDNLPKAAIIGDFRFPFGDAASNRVHSLAKALKDGGWRAVVISRGRPRPEDEIESGRYSIEGIAYWPYTDIEACSLHERLGRPERALARELGDRGVDAVLLYASASWPFVPGMIKFCRKNRLPLAADVVERYGPRQFPRGLLDPRYYLFSFVFGVYFHRIRHIVAISRYLEGYFTGKGCLTARIPAIADCAAIPHSDSPPGGERLRLVYAGSPGRKDLIINALKGLLLLTDEELTGIEFNLLGPAQAEMAVLLGGEIPERLRGIVHARGRVPVREVSEWLIKSDFTVLLREDRRFTRAGFPSKVPESLAHGVPLLANITGDLALYLKDGRECVEVSAPAPEAFAEALRRALLLPPERIAQMKRAARRCAEENFDYRKYIAALTGVLGGACRDMGSGARR